MWEGSCPTRISFNHFLCSQCIKNYVQHLELDRLYSYSHSIKEVHTITPCLINLISHIRETYEILQ